MINENDLNKLKKALNSQELKEKALIMFNESLLASTTITAPEIRLCLHTLKTLLADDKEIKKATPNNIAE
jgi:hypothetical protein